MRRATTFTPRVALAVVTGVLACAPAAPAQEGLERPALGVSIGNTPHVVGLRANTVDEGGRRVDGINLTLWKPGENPELVVNGAAIGLVAPAAKEINGIAIGGVAVVTEEALRGIGAAGLALISEGGLRGLNLAGLATVSEGRQSGIMLAGLAAVSEGRQSGVTVAGLAAVSEEGMEGVTGAGYNSVHGLQIGVSVGLYNYARELRGVQVGVLNYARNNPPALRLLPLVNAHF